MGTNSEIYKVYPVQPGPNGHYGNMHVSAYGGGEPAYEECDSFPDNEASE